MVFKVHLQHHVAPFAGKRDDLVERARIGKQGGRRRIVVGHDVAEGSFVVRIEARIFVIAAGSTAAAADCGSGGAAVQTAAPAKFD